MTIRLNDSKKTRLKILALLFAVLAAGASLAWWMVLRADREMRDSLLEATQLVAQGVNLERIKALSGTESDLGTPAYQQLKEQLAAIRSANPRCRLVYLLGRKPNDTLFIFVDSEPDSSKDYSPPGQTYDKATAAFHNVFVTGKNIVEGPVHDRWGTWVSTLVPLVEPQRGIISSHDKVLSTLGMDINARTWIRRLAFAAMPAILLTLALAAILLAGAVLLGRRSRNTDRSLRQIRHLEPALAAAFGMVLTLCATWMTHDRETYNHNEAFGQLAASRTADISEILCNLRDTQLEGLAHFYENRSTVSGEEFQHYISYLAKNQVIQAWGWIPAVSAADKSRFEEEARAAGWKDFGIWQKDEQGKRVPASGRDVYYPVFQVAPVAGNERAIGYDLGSEPLRRQALEESASKRLPIGTEPITLVQETESQKGMSIFRPVFDGSDSKHPRGFVLAVLRMGTLLKCAGEDESIPMQLSLLRKDLEPETLASTWDTTAPPISAHSVMRTVFAFGKVFAVTTLTAQEFMILGHHPGRSAWVVVLTGLLLTSALTLVISVLLRRRKELEQLLVEMTKNQLIAQHARDPLLLVTLDGRIIEGNHAAEKLYGYTRKELLQLRIADLRTEESAETVEFQMRQAKHHGILFEATHIRKDGTTVPVEVNSQGVIVEGQQMILSVIRDITERKQDEAALRLSKEKFAIAFDANPAAIAMTSLDDGRFIEVNDTWVAMNDYKRDEIIGSSARTLPIWPTKEVANRFVQTLQEKGSLRGWEQEFRAKSGKAYIAELSAQVLVVNGEKVVLTCLVDITDRKQAEEARRESEERNRSILHAAMDGFWLVDNQGCLLEVNEAYCQMSGYSASELIGMRVSDLVVSETEDQTAARIQNLIAQGKERFETQHRCKDGSVFDVEASVQYRPKEDHYVSFLHDITQRKVAQREIAHANASLERGVIERTEELRKSKDQLRLLLDSTAESIYGINTNGDCTFCNPACLRMLGYEREEELLGKNMHWQIHHKHADGSHFEAEDCRIFHAFKNDEGAHVDDEVLWRADGTSFPAEYWSFPQHLDGVVVGAVVTFLDITARKWAQDELKKSVSLINSLLDSIPDLIFFKDIHGVYMGCNPSFVEFVGRPREEIVGKNDLELFGKEIADAFRENDRAVLELRQTRSNEEWINYPDGRKKVVDTVKTPYWGPNGELIGILGISRDITERKWANLEMRKLSSVIEHSPVSVVITDLVGNIEYVNPYFTLLTGYSSEEVIHKNPRILKSGKTPPEIYADLWKTITNGMVWRGELTNCKKNGELFVESAVISPISDGNGAASYYVAIKEDITERKQAERVSIQQREQLQRMLDTAPVGVGISVDGVIRFANPRMTELVDLKPGKSSSTIYTNPADQERMLQVLAREGIVQDWEFKMRGPHGEAMDTMGTFLRTEYEGHEGILCWLVDIGKLKAVELAMRQAKDVAESASRAKSTFLANMSHEIRTPMNAILGFSQLMLHNRDLPTKQKKHLETINRSGEHLLALINDILDMAKIEAGRIELNPSPFDLSALLHDLEAMFRARTDAKELKLDILKMNDLPQCCVADKSKLFQVLINLLGNAVKFTDQGGLVLRVYCEKKARMLFFDVEDTGTGIPCEAIDKLFRPFVQAHNEQHAGTVKGTGLGLAISREIARLMGGDINVTSKVGEGSIFRFSIPLMEGEMQHPERTARLQRVVGLKSGQPSYRVLIVDDTKDNQTLLSEMLSRAGFLTRAVSSGKKAIEVFKTWNPHLILLDMRMPSMDGAEAIQRIRATPHGHTVKIMSVTANTFESMRREALEVGADDFLGKPFKEDELFEKIRLLLGAEYEYDQEPRENVEPNKAATPDFSPEELASLPLDLVEQIRQAAINADYDLLLELTQSVESTNQKLSQGLYGLAERYDYQKLLSILTPNGVRYES